MQAKAVATAGSRRMKPGRWDANRPVVPASLMQTNPVGYEPGTTQKR